MRPLLASIKNPWHYIVGSGVLFVLSSNLLLAIGLRLEINLFMLAAILFGLLVVAIVGFRLLRPEVRSQLNQTPYADIKGGLLLGFFVLAFFLGGLLVAENYARTLPQSHWLVYYVHPELKVLLPYPHQNVFDSGWSVPHQVSTNDIGFRKTQHTDVPNAIYELNILAIGDPYTFGFAVDDNQTYPYYLERTLEAELGAEYDVCVYNSGVLWWTIDNQLAAYNYLLRQGLVFDLVVLGYFPGNDILELEQNPFLLETLKGDPIPAELMLKSALLRWRRYHQFHFGIPLYRAEVEKLKNELSVEELMPVYAELFDDLVQGIEANAQQLYVFRIDGVGNPGTSSKTGLFIETLTREYHLPLVTLPYRDEDYLHPLDAHYSPTGNQHLAQVLASTIASNMPHLPTKERLCE